MIEQLAQRAGAVGSARLLAVHAIEVDVDEDREKGEPVHPRGRGGAVEVGRVEEEEPVREDHEHGAREGDEVGREPEGQALHGGVPHGVVQAVEPGVARRRVLVRRQAGEHALAEVVVPQHGGHAAWRSRPAVPLNTVELKR